MAADIILFSRIILNCGLYNCICEQVITEERLGQLMTTVSSSSRGFTISLYKTSSSCEKWRYVCACMKKKEGNSLGTGRHFSSKFGFQSG